MPRTLSDFDDAYMLKVAEAAECLRFSTDAIYEMVHTGAMPALKHGRKIRIPVFSLKQWVQRQTGQPESEP